MLIEMNNIYLGELRGFLVFYDLTGKYNKFKVSIAYPSSKEEASNNIWSCRDLSGVVESIDMYRDLGDQDRFAP